ncbi:MAG: DJ-1/PfpI family protein [Pleurocapsa sp. MO_192.B19]|nr:DJ-1/PfpI family protein [Pleurocapsa sp. MO_192.B19]
MVIKRYFGKIIIFTLAFVLPPLIIGVLAIAISVSDLMHGNPEYFPTENINYPSYDRSKQTAVILVSNEGTETTDLLVPYEIFSASNKFNVYTVAPKRQISPLTSGGVDIIPDFSFAEFEQNIGSSPDLIVIPAVHNWQYSALINWIVEHNQEKTTILSICEGARLLAATGLLENRQATTHWLTLNSLQKKYPNTEWVKDVKYLESGNIITTPGVITGAMNGSLFTLEKLAGKSVAKDVAQKLNYPLIDSTEFKSPNLEFKDMLLLLIGAYKWHKENTGVFLNEGIGEINLTAVLDTYPRSFTARTISIAPERKIVHSQYGLDLVPRFSFASTPKLDRLLVLDNQSHLSLKNWATNKNNLELESLSSLSKYPDRFIFDNVLRDLAQQENKPLAKVVAKTLEYQVDSINLEGKDFPLWLLLKPLAIALVSLAVVVIGLDNIYTNIVVYFKHLPSHLALVKLMGGKES